MEIFILLIMFQVKHFLCDYPLQGKYMLGKFKETGWQLPLLSHAGIHAIFTGLITSFVSIKLIIPMMILDLFVHFIVDRVKVVYSQNVTTSEPKFWWYLGLDQMIHHLTHYLIIFILLV